ncbi:FtsW/RodA/SpoVE family cell cycle protein [Companilactobacillus keshanensis]|uniref:Probable peptidoglycan glycosyltransferase FtsW n=1 Tax=Companilactobacillus keshanensis TaxID=2486003 RepID=A0ABW4BSN7_9LACO|nr:putative peptidoglycan glycosyltransferase FtsW [Companilactobacillus keshanensis]
MKKLKLIDLWILIPYIILLGIGVVMVYSASFYNAMSNGGSTNQYLIKQGMYAFISLILFFITFMLKVKFFKSSRTRAFLLAVTLVSLALLLVRAYFNPSSRINGASAWINFGPINFQPLELAKITLILYLAYILTSRRSRLLDNEKLFDSLNVIREPVITVLTIIVLVGFQPDIGGALILGLITIVLISSSSIPFNHILKLDGSLLGAFLVGIFWIAKFQPKFIIKNYQYQRILAMLHPFQLERTSGNQLVNSFYAISNGGIFGVGLGNSIQKRGYLPEPHTDFILAIISEELGLVGVFIVLGLLGLIIFRMLYLGMKSVSTYNVLVYYGVAVMMLAQTILNVGGLLGLMPLTGVTLPFISYGGSSLLVLSFSLGIVLNLEATNKFNIEKHR